jgi:hypothetical protein
MRAVARTAVIAGTATVVSNRVSRRQAGRWAAQEQQQPQQQPMEATPYEQQVVSAQPSAAQPTDKVAMLKELAALKDQGVLTDAEFATQKQRVLAG